MDWADRQKETENFLTKKEEGMVRLHFEDVQYEKGQTKLKSRKKRTIYKCTKGEQRLKT
jgi:hypothetical protein